MPNRPYLTYRVGLAIALALLTTRIGLNTLFSSASDITAVNLANAVNKERSSRNITTLNYNSKLAAAADYKAHDMIDRKYFSHTDPDGKYIWDKIVAEGYTPYTVLGENLAVNFSSTEGLVNAWIDSPTHRANLLNTNFKDQGMGVAFGNPTNGEHSVSVANTFGAQPSQPKPPVVEQPAPTKPAETPTPKPTPTPSPTPAPAPTITLTINNSEEISYKNSITIVGHTLPNISISLQDLNDPSQQPIKLTADSNGNFVYTYKSLNTGYHNFVATSAGATSNQYKVQVLYNPPQINRDSVAVSPSIQGQALTLSISAQIDSAEGQEVLANASLAGKTVPLTKDGEKYSAVLSFEKYFEYERNDLVITAKDSYGNTNNLTVPLEQFPMKESEDPKALGNISEKAGSPDLYNVFKYIVIVFGTLFAIFMLGDITHLRRNKYASDFTKGSNIIVLLLIISTLLLVNWWH